MIFLRIHAIIMHSSGTRFASKWCDTEGATIFENQRCHMGNLLSTVATVTLPLAGAMLALVVVARFAYGQVARVEGYSFSSELVVRDNPAVGLRLASLLFACVIAFFGVAHPSGVSVIEDLNLYTQYALVVLGGLFVSLKINDFWILYGFDNNKEVVGEKNVAVAIVEASTYLATGLIFSGALHGALGGKGGGIWVSVGWFVIGQVMLIGLTAVYRIYMRVDRGIGIDDFTIDDTLDNHNCACAIDLGSVLLSGGLALKTAVSGDFHGWAADLPQVGLFMGVWLVLMVLTQVVANFAVVPGQAVKHEIMIDKNWGVAWVCAALRVAFTLVYIQFLG